MVSGVCVVLLCFFFKQKTAYEMRISDWSSDVCSSDLVPPSHLVVADRRLEDGRHFVFADDRAWHRLWLRTDRPGVPLANLILRDSLVGLRHEAAVRFDRCLGDGPGPPPAGFLPTAYQARRLGMMLAFLDLLQEPGGAGVTSHDVARLIIYPRLSVGRGAEWKSSSERRRTQRLIEEARGLMQGGYRALLAGPAGRQKLP